MSKRYSVGLIAGHVCFYGEYSVQYEHHLFDTIEEATDFRNRHFPNCTEVFDLENLPF